MKILILNPHIQSSDPVATALQAQGSAILLPADAKEAWQMLQLHGQSVDLAVVHREGAASEEEGFEFLARVKGSTPFADLPIIVSSEKWGDAEFAGHQDTPQGANAYLAYPFDAGQLTELIGAVMGTAGAGSNAGSEMLPTAVMDFSERSAEIPTAFKTQMIPNLGQTLEPEGDALAGTMQLDVSQTGLSGLTAAQPEEPSSGGQDLEDESSASQEMPYLFGKGKSVSEPVAAASPIVFSPPLGDAVVPGGAAHTPDMETLKKYLLLREQDVGALSNQMRSAKEQIADLERQLREQRTQNDNLAHTAAEQKRKLDEFEMQKRGENQALQTELEELRFQNKTKTDKARVMEMHVKDAAEEMELLKERVRADIRKIRVREKELENRLEITKKDSEALISARENKIIELKRKLDILEFNMDLLQNKYSREKEVSAQLRERLGKASQALRIAGGLLGASGDAAGEAAAPGGFSGPQDGKKREAS